MMARFLDLRPDCLDRPTPYDVAVVGAAMLWPDDDDLRHRATTASALELAFLSGAYPPPRTFDEIRQYRDLAKSIPSTADFTESVREGIRRGWIAGAMLRDVVLTGATLASAKLRLAASFGLAVKTIENSIWSADHYRPVAAYWAAFVHVFPSMSPKTPIPCQPNELGIFLAMADEFRRRGEAGRTRQSPTPSVLRPGETVRVPAEIGLPRGRILLAPAPETIPEKENSGG